MAGKDFGGRMSVRLSDGSTLPLRGNFTLMDSDQSNEAMTNQDNSVDRIGTPVSPSAEVTFSDSGVETTALMKAARQNFVVTEDFTGVTHHFINAFFTGRASKNRMTGEVSGLVITAETYRKTGA